MNRVRCHLYASYLSRHCETPESRLSSAIDGTSSAEVVHCKPLAIGLHSYRYLLDKGASFVSVTLCMSVDLMGLAYI